MTVTASRMPTRVASDFDLAIVGGGIAGPAMACAWADTGQAVLLVERSGEALDTARGDNLQPKSCEWLEAWSVLDDMWALGAEKRLGARYLSNRGELVMRVPVDDLDIPHPYFVYLNHELISQALLMAAARNPNFSIRRPAIAKLMRGDSGYSLAVESDAGLENISARLIVAADGRNSRLRRAAGIETDEYAYRNPMLTLFAPRCISDSRNEVRVYFSARGMISVIPRTGGHWKIGLPLPREEIAEFKRASPQELGARLAAWLPELADILPVVGGVYPITCAHARRWTDANLVLLGDACNTLHPGLSQGMNVALRAVARLTALLREHDALHSDDELRSSLLAFEAELKPSMDARLAENHMRGLAMDRLDAASTQQMRDSLAAIAADPQRHAAYCLSAAGYW